MALGGSNTVDKYQVIDAVVNGMPLEVAADALEESGDAMQADWCRAGCPDNGGWEWWRIYGGGSGSGGGYGGSGSFGGSGSGGGYGGYGGDGGGSGGSGGYGVD